MTSSANDSRGLGDRQAHVAITRREALQIGYSGLLGVSLTSARRLGPPPRTQHSRDR